MTLISPNTVVANALTAVEDVLTPRIHVVGTQINGAPHAGTCGGERHRLHQRH
jgi:hypothetical protein